MNSFYYSQMVEEGQQITTWSSALDWVSLQGVPPSLLPTNIMSVLQEDVVLIPDMGVSISMWMYVVLTQTILPFVFNIAGLSSISVNIGSSPTLLLQMQVPNSGTDPLSAVSSPKIRSCTLKVIADGTPGTANNVRGVARSGMVGDFNGDLYAKLSQQPDVTCKSKAVGQAQGEFELSLIPGAVYTRTLVRISPVDWAQSTYDPTIVYVICRSDLRSSGMSVSCNPMTAVYLELPQGSSAFTIQAYARPYVDTGDPAVRVVHVYALLTVQGFSLQLVPNLLVGSYCENSPYQNLTWLFSMILPPSNSSTVPIFANAPWQPAISAWSVYNPRVVSYAGLSGNRITMTASGESEIPPGMIGTIFNSLPYVKQENPFAVVERINDADDPNKIDGYRRVLTRQFTATSTEFPELVRQKRMRN